jgi:hypothetical protein
MWTRWVVGGVYIPFALEYALKPFFNPKKNRWAHFFFTTWQEKD